MKFRKVSTVEGTIVFVPNEYYLKLRKEIRGSIAHVAFTRSYIYWIGDDDIMYRHSRNMEFYEAKHKCDKIERVVSQCACYPDVLFV